MNGTCQEVCKKKHSYRRLFCFVWLRPLRPLPLPHASWKGKKSQVYVPTNAKHAASAPLSIALEARKFWCHDCGRVDHWGRNATLCIRCGEWLTLSYQRYNLIWSYLLCNLSKYQTYILQNKSKRGKQTLISVFESSYILFFSSKWGNWQPQLV